MKPKISFTKQIQLWGIILIIGVSISITTIDIVGSYRDFNAHADQMRADYIARQKQMVKREVEWVVDLIRSEKAQIKSLTKSKIRSRVYEAVAIAQYIYQQNKAAKSKPEIQQMIIDALKPIRFEGGSGYYFATRLDGIGILFSDRPELEGTDLRDIQDTQGRYVVKDMIQIAGHAGEGFYEYFWTKPDSTGNDFKKISFIKRFERYDWLIGAGLYVDDIENQIKEDLLASISRIRFGGEGYIFINTFNGDALLSNGKRVSGTQKLWEVFDKNPEKSREIFKKEYDAALKPDGGFIYYSIVKLSNPDKESPKTSFIYGIPELQWLVGAGVYLDDVETDIAVMQAGMKKQIAWKIFDFALIAVGVVLFFLLMFNRLSRSLKKDLNLFISFCNGAAVSNEPIDRDLVQFDDLDQMACNANKMLADRIQAEEAVRRSEAKFRGLVESSSDWIWETNAEGIYTYASPPVKAMLGYTPDEVIGKTPFDLMPPDEADRIAALFNKLTAKGESIIALENVTLHKDGRRIILETSGVPVFDKAGAVIGYRGVDRDITERKQTEKRLIESEELYRSIVTQALEGIVLYDLKTKKLLDCNDAYQKMLGYTKDEIRSLTLYDVVNHSRESIDYFVKRIVNEKQVWIGPRKHRRKDGSLLDVEINSSVIVLQGKEVLSTVVHDITERKRAEEELKKMEKLKSVGTLAGGIAHDFNNILMGLFGNISLAREKISRDHPANSSLKEAEKSMNRAVRLTRQLLTFAKGGAPVKERIRLPALVEEVIRFDLSGSNVKPVFKAAGDLWPAKVDKGQVQQVFSNLTINARQAMPNGGHLSVMLENADISKNAVPGLDPGKYIKVMVTDEGTGIDPKHLDRIFDPYFTTKHAGNGLGLATVYSIITRHGGGIHVASQPGKGTTFTVYLPASNSQQPLVTRESVAEGPIIEQSGKILVMDDDEMICRVAAEMLERSGFSVETASDGVQAAEMYQQALDTGSPFDVVVMDLTIPGGVGGKEAIQNILNIHPEARVVVSSGYAHDPVMANYAEYGFSGIVAKPYTKSKLLEVLSRVLTKE